MSVTQLDNPSRRSLAVVGFALVVAACADQPAPTDTGAAATPAATVRPTSIAGPDDALAGQPACLDAKLVWADALDRLLMANCVDQLDLASLEELWAWDGVGAEWEQLSNDGPPANVVTGFGWDPDRDVLVRYGGIPLPEQDCSAETWEWDMTSWRQIDAEPAEACDHIELAWDPSVGRMLLVGGGRAQSLTAGTWALDGTAWTELTDAGPAPRAHHGLATDGANGQVLLHGGLDNSQLFDDLWGWDGSAWEDIGVGGSSPGRRSHHGFAVGPTGALLFGGATSTSTFGSLVDDTWLLADGSWSRIERPGPSARGLPALGHDPDRDVFVLHGGFDAEGNPLADTWEFDGDAWSCIAGC